MGPELHIDFFFLWATTVMQLAFPSLPALRTLALHKINWQDGLEQEFPPLDNLNLCISFELSGGDKPFPLPHQALSSLPCWDPTNTRLKIRIIQVAKPNFPAEAWRQQEQGLCRAPGQLAARKPRPRACRSRGGCYGSS